MVVLFVKFVVFFTDIIFRDGTALISFEIITIFTLFSVNLLLPLLQLHLPPTVLSLLLLQLVTLNQIQEQMKSSTLIRLIKEN